MTDTYHHIDHPKAQRFDRVEARVVERWKESELSGDEWRHRPWRDIMITDDDRYLWLHGAIENLCRAQTEMTDTEASAKLGEAVHLIAEVGHGINPRSDTFRRNMRQTTIDDQQGAPR